MRLRSAVGAGVLVLIAVTPAAAHVIPQPAYLTPGEQTTITFAAPNERPPHRLVGLTITAPAGIKLANAPAPRGWTLSIAGRTATWSGITALQDPFRILTSTSLEPGIVKLQAVQRYDDGGLVRWNVAFTILPAATPTPREHVLPAIVTAILGLVVIGLLLFRMRDRRRPDLREE
jgi:hypothetical protein